MIGFGLGAAIGLLFLAAVGAFKEQEEEPSSSEIISQIRCDAERSMRQASDDYLKSVKEVTRR